MSFGKNRHYHHMTSSAANELAYQAYRGIVGSPVRLEDELKVGFHCSFACFWLCNERLFQTPERRSASRAPMSSDEGKDEGNCWSVETSRSTSSSSNCSLCQVVMNGNEEPMATTGCHTFCRQCILRWVKHNNRVSFFYRTDGCFRL